MAARKHRPLIAGNWKMNGLAASGAELQAMIAASEPLASKVDLLICPPATLVAAFCSLFSLHAYLPLRPVTTVFRRRLPGRRG